MNLNNSLYLKNFIIALGSWIALLIAFLAFGINMQSFQGSLIWFFVLIDFILFLFLMKILFPWFNKNEIIHGVWAGLVLYCWAPILKLSWVNNFINALKISIIYLIIGIAVFFLGYWLMKKIIK
jgi:hypothetical protein